MHPYSSMDTATALKISHFILSNRSDLHTIDNLSVAFPAFATDVVSLSEYGSTDVCDIFY